MPSSRHLVAPFFGLLFVTAGFAQQPDGDPAATEVWDPEPAVVDPGSSERPPSDAVILFDGSDLSGWQHADGSAAGWETGNGAMTVVGGTGDIETRQSFGDAQLHVEWRTPTEITGDSQGRGNSGIFLQKRYEVQVLDSYDNRTYANGQAASIYKQHSPLVNATRPPGEWQTYDIVFKAPRFAADGSLQSPAFITVLHNGVLVQNNVELAGPTVYIGAAQYAPHPARQPLSLQDHGNAISFRNIWIRDLSAD